MMAKMKREMMNSMKTRASAERDGTTVILARKKQTVMAHNNLHLVKNDLKKVQVRTSMLFLFHARREKTRPILMLADRKETSADEAEEKAKEEAPEAGEEALGGEKEEWDFHDNDDNHKDEVNRRHMLPCLMQEGFPVSQGRKGNQVMSPGCHFQIFALPFCSFYNALNKHCMK